MSVGSLKMEDTCERTVCGRGVELSVCLRAGLPGRFGGPEFTGAWGAAGMPLLIVCEDRRMSF